MGRRAVFLTGGKRRCEYLGDERTSQNSSLPRTPVNSALRDPPYTLTASAFVTLLAELWAPTSVILFEILTGQWRVGR